MHINDVPKSEESKLVTYVDDFMILALGKTEEQARKKERNAINNIIA